MIGVWTNQYPFNEGFTVENQQQNARELWGYFQSQGWTLEAVSGMLGNMQVESYINPAQWQLNTYIEDPDPNNRVGFGIVQWTPWQKYANWAGANWRTNYSQQPRRIQYELEVDRTSPDSLQWLSQGIMSFYEFSQSTQTPAQLARVFFTCYERGTVYGDRDTYANNWYQYLGGVGPLSPRPPIWLLFKLKERFS